MSQIEQAFCRSAPWRSAARRVILPWALQELRPSGHLLELGSGSGAMAEATARSFPDLRLTVTDLDPAMVTAMRRRLANTPAATVERADVTDLPYDDGSFDVVASYLMLHHVIEWTQALAEAARVLRPAGTLVGYDLTRTRAARAIHWADRSPHRLIEADEFRPALERAGFVDIEVRRGLGQHVVRFTARRAA